MKLNESVHVKNRAMRISRKLKKQLKAKHGRMWRWEAAGKMMAKSCAGSVRAIQGLNKAFAGWPTMIAPFPVDGYDNMIVTCSVSHNGVWYDGEYHGSSFYRQDHI